MKNFLSIFQTRLVLAGLVLAAAIFALPVAARAATHDVGTPEDLATVVDSVYSGNTIRLTADIDYSGGIVINNKTITGYTLNVTNAAG